ncbi:MAG: ATP-dependent RecD-like DNA helicase [Sedimenticola sp.]
MGCRRSSAFWGLGCPKAHHEIEDSLDNLTEQQTNAVSSALANRVSCITGGAGTGKTTVLRTVLRAYDYLEYDIKAMALSGRAAMRLHESIGFPTSTIAKFLRDDPIEAISDDDLKCLIVIDEASMLDIGTMYKIVLHSDPSVKFLFVGDPNQLPPIGPGLVLADIVKSRAIANIELNIVKRQDATTGIPEYSRMVQRGYIPADLSMGCIHFHDTPYDQVANVCTQLYADDKENSRVVAATNVMTGDVNRNCQSLLNESAPYLAWEEFGQQYQSRDLKLGDPVLFTQNNYDAGVQNGSLGTLISIVQSEKHHGVVKLDDTGEEVELNRSLLDSLVPGYAITLHKAQGSQFKRVIVGLSETSMIDRAWIYTAITRAEAELHIVGPKERLHKAITSMSAHHIRKTHLHNLLAEDIQ